GWSSGWPVRPSGSLRSPGSWVGGSGDGAGDGALPGIRSEDLWISEGVSYNDRLWSPSRLDCGRGLRSFWPGMGVEDSMDYQMAGPRPSSTIGLGLALIAAALAMPTARAQPPLVPGAVPEMAPAAPAGGSSNSSLEEFFPGMTTGTHPNPDIAED